MKICRKCKENKSTEEFAKRASSKDGLDSRCLVCVRESSKASVAKNREKNKDGPAVKSKLCPCCRLEKGIESFGQYLGNKDGLRSECYECRNLKSRSRYANDFKFRLSESTRAAKNYQKDRDRILNRTKLWAKSNPDKKVEQRHRRIARLHGQFDFNLPKDYQSILRKKQNNLCAYCLLERKLTVDHIIPIAHGGKHIFDNIVLACTTCNCSKQDKTLSEWLAFNESLIGAGIQSNILVTICENIKKIQTKLDETFEQRADPRVGKFSACKSTCAEAAP